MQSNNTISGTPNAAQKLNDLFQTKWNNLNDRQKELAKKIWGIISYKWQWQIILNAPFLMLWILDQTVPSVHEFNINILSALPKPQWLTSLIEKV